MAFETDSEDDYVPPKDASDDGEDEEQEQEEEDKRPKPKKKNSAQRRSRSRANSVARSAPQPHSRSHSRSRAKSATPGPGDAIKSKILVLDPLDWGSDGEDKSDATLRGRSRKRPFEDDEDDIEIAELVGPPRFKRQRGMFNSDYLDLLNRDIEDAATQTVLDEYINLAPSQLGLSVWTASEKAVFFEALGRRGRDNVPAIRARLPSKSEVEIIHYLHVLRRSTDALKARHKLPWMTPVSIPAALELSSQCCQALEEAADVIALRQETHEQQVEQKKWGPNCWNTTPSVARDLLPDSAGQMTDRNVDFSVLFELATWLRLSERIFMNSAEPDRNWRHVDGERPSIWATALEDFYSLAVSFTRRLVHTTLQFSESRARAKRTGAGEASRIVKRRDVETAVACLGVAPNSRRFWARCPRRLRLRVRRGDEDGFATQHVGDVGDEQEVKSEAGQDEERDDAMDVDVDPVSIKYADSDQGSRDEDARSEDSRDRAGEDPDEPGMMSYDDVERLLSDDHSGDEGRFEQDLDATKETPGRNYDGAGNTAANYDEDEEDGGDEEDVGIHDASNHSALDTGNEETGGGGSDGNDDDDQDSAIVGPWQEEIQQDVKEAMVLSATALPQTRKARQGLEARIRSEIQHETYADFKDMQAGRQEEMALFELLGQPAPHIQLELGQHEPPHGLWGGAPPPPVSSLSGNTLVPEQDWRRCVKYLEEWETQEEQQRRAAAQAAWEP